MNSPPTNSTLGNNNASAFTGTNFDIRLGMIGSTANSGLVSITARANIV